MPSMGGVEAAFEEDLVASGDELVVHVGEYIAGQSEDTNASSGHELVGPASIAIYVRLTPQRPGRG